MPSFTGSHQARPLVHHHSAGLSYYPLADQVLLPDLHPVPADVGGDDRNTQVPGSGVYSSRAQDPGRHHAGDDQEGGGR